MKIPIFPLNLRRSILLQPLLRGKTHTHYLHIVSLLRFLFLFEIFLVTLIRCEGEKKNGIHQFRWKTGGKFPEKSLNFGFRVKFVGFHEEEDKDFLPLRGFACSKEEKSLGENLNDVFGGLMLESFSQIARSCGRGTGRATFFSSSSRAAVRATVGESSSSSSSPSSPRSTSSASSLSFVNKHRFKPYRNNCLYISSDSFAKKGEISAQNPRKNIKFRKIHPLPPSSSSSSTLSETSGECDLLCFDDSDTQILTFQRFSKLYPSKKGVCMCLLSRSTPSYSASPLSHSLAFQPPSFFAHCVRNVSKQKVSFRSQFPSHPFRFKFRRESQFETHTHIYSLLSPLKSCSSSHFAFNDERGSKWSSVTFGAASAGSWEDICTTPQSYSQKCAQNSPQSTPSGFTHSSSPPIKQPSSTIPKNSPQPSPQHPPPNAPSGFTHSLSPPIKQDSSTILQTSPQSPSQPPHQYPPQTTPPKSTYYLTSPVFYVNANPHIGHAYTLVACDVFSRFISLDGENVFFLTGTDENAAKIVESAHTHAMDAEDFVCTKREKFWELMSCLDCKPNIFLKTSGSEHRQVVERVWRKLQLGGYIYKGKYMKKTPVSEEEFEGGAIDAVGDSSGGVEGVDCYFFRLFSFREALMRLYERKIIKISPESAANAVMKFISSGLHDVAISRPNTGWGIAVPGDSKHSVYVWFDALLSYISGVVGNQNVEDILEGNANMESWPPDLHIIGKDILRFHAVLWPAMLIAAGFQLPRKIFAHGWWLYDGQKMSKSLHNVVDPFQLVKRVGKDSFRYFLMSEVAFGSDAVFNERAVFAARDSLADTLGNLAHRVLVYVHRRFDRKIPPLLLTEKADDEILRVTSALLPNLRSFIKEQSVDAYAKELMGVARKLNKYLQLQAPWKQADNSLNSRASTTLYVMLEALRRLAICFQPLIPEAAQSLLDMLGIPPSQRSFDKLSSPMRAGDSLPAAQPRALISKVEGA